MVLFIVHSASLLYVFYDRTSRGLLHSVTVALGVLLLTAPWWGTVIAFHGLSPFMAAGAASQWSPFSLFSLLLFDFTESSLVPLVTAFALVSFFTSVRKRSLFLPTWIIAIFLVGPRTAGTYATTPAAMLAAVFLTDLLLPSLGRTSSTDDGGPTARRPVPIGSPAGWFIAFVLLLMTLNAVVSTSVTPGLRPAPTRALASTEREATAWIVANVPEDASFVLLTSAPTWGWDWMSEWFPVLTGRRSIATAQGTEWLPDGGFTRAIRRYDKLQRCGAAGLECLLEWRREFGQLFTHVILHGVPETALIADGRPVSVEPDCCSTLREQMLVSPSFRLIYSNESIWVFESTGSSVAVQASDLLDIPSDEDEGGVSAFSAARPLRERLFHVDRDGGRVTYSYRAADNAWVVVSVTESPPIIVERQRIP